ncbi:carboxypeptidase family protein [Ulvibacter antarcticus]|uniref:Carboxypeptidase family protein n=1 Tax=Ulvibacter antarcticus TaxID=442714 RepID=A0A3L9YEI8_9FLAO|nr:carboxypeptidase family protein [Ulvibacter antarcticus]
MYCLFVTALFSCSEEGFNENGIGIISGTVVEEGENTPLANVKITTTPATNTVFTNADGEFEIDNVASGDYSVQASLDEYIAKFQAANVTDSNVTNVVFELVKSLANNVPPLAPTLLFPPDNATELGFTVNFIWTTIDEDEDDLTYSMELRNGNTNEIQIFETESDTTVTVQNLQLATNYFWQVTVSDDINEPVVSPVSEFTTLTELTNPILLVKTVNNNSVIYSGDIGEEGDTDVNLIQLTSENQNSFRPRRNSTVRKIAFLRTVGGNTQLFTMNYDGTEVDQITNSRPVKGFRDDYVDFCWATDGQLLYYPNFDKLYRIDPDAGGATLVFQTTDGSLISEVDTPQFNENLLVLKTNDINGYNVRIFTLDITSGTGVEDQLVLEDEPGAIGGINISFDGQTVLYTKDDSQSQNSNYRIIESRMYQFDLASGTESILDSEAVTGQNDLYPRYSPAEGTVIFTRKNNNLTAVPAIYTITLDGSKAEDLLFTGAAMPDWD